MGFRAAIGSPWARGPWSILRSGEGLKPLARQRARVPTPFRGCRTGSFRAATQSGPLSEHREPGYRSCDRRLELDGDSRSGRKKVF